jgi:Flp pilus assembly protein CpaB
VAIAALIAFATTQGDDAGIEVIVAARDLPAGVVLTADDLALAEVDLPAPVAARAVADPDLAIGATLRVELGASELVQRSALDEVVDDGTAFEVAVELDEAAAVGGRLRAGDRVLVVVAGDEPAQLGPVLVTAVAPPDDAIGGRGVVVVLGVDDGALIGELGALGDDDLRLVRLAPGADG